MNIHHLSLLVACLCLYLTICAGFNTLRHFIARHRDSVISSSRHHSNNKNENSVSSNNNRNSSTGSSQSFLIPHIDSLSYDIEDEFENIKNSRGIIPTGKSSDQMVSGLDGSVRDAFIAKQSKGNANAARYFSIVEKLSPNDMIQKFGQTAPKNIQEACKSTVMSILGNLPNYALDASLLTTSTKLANLLYQMQLTGYMFKNAEYRISLTRSLKGLPRLPSSTVIKQGNLTISNVKDVEGDVKVRADSGESVSLPVSELTGALSEEINELRMELALLRNDRENELRSNMLTYIQAMPESELAKLTTDMSDDVIQAIQMLVNAVMEKLGIDTSAGDEVIIQQSVGPLAQLCMWQLILGYKLRELEALDKGVSIN